ncbi:hypothetical protein H8R18_06915 [Nanchangia anserum]|uniref:Uncharacterized protein n=1 Tax=Nanchangia anserum TaxID=2692125 RepID=A0A8I0GC28_9ACTO|nr:hypothetical protein [Nanchangia anserum]MBD3689261.1 hypothetical protein [Nanchangia anserum]QOX81482.1 hypothetical protein H8R18_06915 [Nanchangia anserum]
MNLADLCSPDVDSTIRQLLHDAITAVDGVAFVASPTAMRRVLEGEVADKAARERIIIATREEGASIDVSIALVSDRVPRVVAPAVADAVEQAWRRARSGADDLPALARTGVHIVSIVSPSSTQSDDDTGLAGAAD